MEIRENHYNPADQQQNQPPVAPQKRTVLLPLYLAVALVIGMLIGSNMSDMPPSMATGFVSSPFTKIREVLTYIQKDYVDEVNTDELVEEAIGHMLEKLDPHTAYIPAAKLETVQAQLQGGFEGIGIEFNIIRDTLYVVAPLSGGPSEAAGIITGDQILEVDGKPLSGPGLNNQKVFESLRGKKGSEVTLTIQRKNQDGWLTFTLERDKIPTYAIDASYMIDEQTGYIKVNRFSATVYDEFLTALTDLKEQGMQRLVLDLQGNPGGLLDQATKMVDEMLAGDDLIVFTKGKGRQFDQSIHAGRKGVAEKMPIVVLINEGSASASEIVAGALQDNDRAVIVGRRSYGKGLVQVPMRLSDGAELRLTISRYYTPSGRSIQKPFGEDIEYGDDLAARYEQGEFFHADSIKFADSLAYSTKKGRTVYGGGGIMPDYFIALDTVGSTDYMRALFYSNALREFALFYYEENQRYLHELSFAEFKDNFVITNDMLDRLIEIGKGNGVTFNASEFEISKEKIVNRLKAYIGRSVWDNKGFFPLINQENESYKQALELFDQAEQLVNQ